MSAPSTILKRPREDAQAKTDLGIVPHYRGPEPSPKRMRGTYAQQRDEFGKTPFGHSVEVDHALPDSLFQAVGQRRRSGIGAQVSRSLPAASMHKLQHRRKNTTGSGAEVEHHRAYLLHVAHGLAPIARRMSGPQDHYAAAAEVDIRSDIGSRTLFGAPSLHDPRDVRTSQQGVVPKVDVHWGLERRIDSFEAMRQQHLISDEGLTQLSGVVHELHGQVDRAYKKRGL